MSHASTQRSRFAALWSGETGVDPYAFAVANPYQDWFGQALFVGKGVFDVDAFYHALVNRIPDNRVLSHDILEGAFCALASWPTSKSLRINRDAVRTSAAGAPLDSW
ncbi:hypothetical protein GCM10025858_28120 [Alicyclobacillus sacchari]|uniref:hypothetical protein n=1 Tax=Alicyclobacillus sacchari TaxID=392010 RepID=UPI0023E99763|nr:hypothetical protein [Alicyclobacillus sacchari]GMA58309.1 hypothetical protein GCM10025858_28120 [Alicyclobacillus sacchari]